MDKCSFFINNKALFGSCPDQETVLHLEDLGTRYFIDLTYPNERLICQYKTKYEKISFPIRDRSIPDNNHKFCAFILHVCSIIRALKVSEKIYVHCKGGHGRSGLVVASILCFLEKITPEVALEKTREAHQQRKTMRDKWRFIGSPQTPLQKDFVKTLFKPILYHSHQYTCFNTLSSNSIQIDHLGTFPTVEAAYQAFKNPFDEEFLEALKNPENDPKVIGRRVKLRKDKDWQKIKIFVMYTILKLKFEQYQEHKTVLLNTFLRPIIKCSEDGGFWSDMNTNLYGKVLEKIRNDLFRLIDF